MTDITDHLKTVREALQSHLAWDTGFDALASLDAIEAELARVREQRDNLQRIGIENVLDLTREREEAKAERDEAVAAMRHIADWDDDVEAEDCPELRGIARDALARLTDPQEGSE